MSLPGCDGTVEPQPLLVSEFELGLADDMSSTVLPGQQLNLHDLMSWATDAAGNSLGASDLVLIPDSRIRWAWHARDPSTRNDHLTELDGDGWTVIVPDLDAAGFDPNIWGAYAIRLQVWITGAGPGQLDLWGASCTSLDDVILSTPAD